MGDSSMISRFYNIRNADDTVLIAHSELELQKIIDAVNECSLRAELNT